MIALYVDDLFIIGANEQRIEQLKQSFKSRFKMTDLGTASKYLGIEIERSDAGILLHQRIYPTVILERFGMANCSTVSSPMDAGTFGTLMSPDEQVDKNIVKWYQSTINSLMYVMVETKPDFNLCCLHIEPLLRQSGAISNKSEGSSSLVDSITTSPLAVSLSVAGALSSYPLIRRMISSS